MLIKIDKCINMQDMPETSKYAQIRRIKLHIFNCGTLIRMSMSSSIKYNLVRLSSGFYYTSL